MKFKPLHDRVLIEVLDSSEKTAGGIIIPDTAQEKPQEGKIVAVGGGAKTEDGKVIPMDVKVGDIVSKGDIIARELSGKLAKNGYLIVSGLARGIDRSAHIGAIDAGGKTIAVVAWLPEIYPADHNTLAEDIKKNGCIISEYFLVDEKSKGLIVKRNQIISALSDFVIVVETGPTGGANYAVEYAHKLSKTVIAIKPKSENTEFNDGFKKLVANSYCFSGVSSGKIFSSDSIISETTVLVVSID